MNHDRILIVGAGLAGLALARALRQAGLASEVIEREVSWENVGTGMYLPANGVRTLRALGLEGAVAARAAEIPRQRLLDHRGRLLADIDLHQLWGDVGSCLALPRADLHQGPLRGRAGANGPHHPVAGAAWTGQSRSPSTTAALASSTWLSAPTGCAPRFGGWPSTIGRRSRSPSTAGGSSPPAHLRSPPGRSGPPPGNLVPDRPGRRRAGLLLRRRHHERRRRWARTGHPVARLRERFAEFAAPSPPACWTNSTTRPGCMWRRSSRSPRNAGAGGQWCWSATPPTACRPTWPRGPPWPSRTPWS